MAGIHGDRAAPSPHQLPARQSAPHPPGRAGLSARRQLMPADISTPEEESLCFRKAKEGHDATEPQSACKTWREERKRTVLTLNDRERTVRRDTKELECRIMELEKHILIS